MIEIYHITFTVLKTIYVNVDCLFIATVVLRECIF